MTGKKVMDYSRWPFCWLWVPLLLNIEVSDQGVSATRATPEQKLRHDLLVNYTVGVRPVLDPEDVLNISFSYRLSRVVSLDIKAQVLTTDAWIVQTWVNPYLSWNQSEYSHVHTLHMSPDEIWVPDIVLYNNADEDVALSGFKEKFKTYVIVDSKGLNKWMSPATFKSSCDMAVRYYPFDKQKCEMTFGSWTYDSRLLKTINPHTEHSPAEKYIESGDWNVSGVSIRSREMKYACCDYPFSDVTYTFFFERKSLYHVMYQILPCVPVIVLVCLNFVIPPDSGERIGFCITILLAMSVFLLILADSLPETSDDTAILGLYYILIMFLVAFSLIGTAVVLRCHFAEGKAPNRLVQLSKFILRRNERNSPASNKVLVHGDQPQTSEDHPMKVTSEIMKNESDFNHDALSVIMQSMKDEKEQNKWKGCWKEIAEALDRFLLVIFLLLTVIVTLSVWLQRPGDLTA